MSRNTFTLAGDWRWKQRDPAVSDVLDELTQHTALAEQGSKDTKSYWREATSSPSEIHVELLKAGLIPDPYKGFDEHKVQCKFTSLICRIRSNPNVSFTRGRKEGMALCLLFRFVLRAAIEQRRAGV